MFRSLVTCILFVLACPLQSADDAGEQVYKTHCAGCHDNNSGQTPGFANLKKLSPQTILDTLSSGSMRLVGAGLEHVERKLVAEYISGQDLDAAADAGMQVRYCASSPALPADLLEQAAWNGWGVDHENTRFQPGPAAGLSTTTVGALKLKWVFALPGEVLALGQPNVIGDRLYVPSHSGNIYALDAKTGCAYWRFKADSSVRTAVIVAKASGTSSADFLAYFTDTTANAYALNAATGELVWKTRIEKHPAVRITGTPQLYRGRLYVPVSTLESVAAANPDYQCCTHRGSVVAVDANNGRIAWQSFTIPDKPARTAVTNAHNTVFYGPSGAGIWSAPTIDTKLNVLYVGTGENSSQPASSTSDAILAMDLDDGRILWSYQSTRDDAWNAACIGDDTRNCPNTPGPDYDFGASPILVALSEQQRVLLAVQKSGEVHALDPDNKGKLLWKQQASPGGLQGGVMWGAATDGERLFVALSDRKGIYAKQADGSRDWQLTAEAGGGLIAYRVGDGSKLWHALPAPCGTRPQCSPAQSGAVSAIPGLVFSGAYDGHIRAYASDDGRVLWDYDTVREYDAVNGIKAQGGALDGPGPTIINGSVYVNSGYARWGGLPGNALLAFSID